MQWGIVLLLACGRGDQRCTERRRRAADPPRRQPARRSCPTLTLRRAPRASCPCSTSSPSSKSAATTRSCSRRQRWARLPAAAAALAGWLPGLAGRAIPTPTLIPSMRMRRTSTPPSGGVPAEGGRRRRRQPAPGADQRQNGAAGQAAHAPQGEGAPVRQGRMRCSGQRGLQGTVGLSVWCRGPAGRGVRGSAPARP